MKDPLHCEEGTRDGGQAGFDGRHSTKASLGKGEDGRQDTPGSGRRRGQLASPRLRPSSRPFPFASPGGEEGIWGSGRRTMLSRPLCAAPSPEGRERAVQRGRGASVVLPLSCGQCSRHAGQEPGAAGSGLP